jgi:predicted Zn-dependent protease
MKSYRSIAFMLCVLAIAAVAAAQQGKGKGQISGKIVDDQGQPIQDVQVVAVLKGAKEPSGGAKTNKKGEWTIKNLAAGEWNVVMGKEGLEEKTLPMTLGEAEKKASEPVTLGKYVDPNTVLQAEAQKAAELFQIKNYAGARKIYEDLLAKYPGVHQLHPMIARTYAAENNWAKAVEHMRIALEKEPANVDNRLFLGELLLEQGNKDEARTMIEGTDITQAKDPYPFLNIAITLINSKKPDEALVILDKVAAKFADQPEVYYYRGRANLAANKMDEAKADLEKFVSMSKTESKEVTDAKNILAQLTKK